MVEDENDVVEDGDDKDDESDDEDADENDKDAVNVGNVKNDDDFAVVIMTAWCSVDDSMV